MNTTPVFIKKGAGAYLWDHDDNRYVDYVGSYGPMILGHADADVAAAVAEAASNSLSFGAPTELEVLLAEKICKLVPSIEKIRMVNSGTEATMSAIRLARGFSGKDKLVKFEGCYHGHADSLLVKAGSGALTLGVPTSPGIPRSVTENTLTLEYNNLAQVAECFEKWGGEIAAVIVEPVAGNMNCVPPVDGFLSGLRQLCDQYRSVLIFDEVMTGFRVGLQCAQGLYQVRPDITTLGKIIGGGMPVGAFGGRAEIMDKLAPEGPVYQAGTLSGNPVAMAAGLVTMGKISEPGFFKNLSDKTERLTSGLENAAMAYGIGLATNRVGAMFGFFFSSEPQITNFGQVQDSDQARFIRFFHGMLDRGIYFAPSAFETGFVSAAHTDSDIEETIAAAKATFSSWV